MHLTDAFKAAIKAQAEKQYKEGVAAYLQAVAILAGVEGMFVMSVEDVYGSPVPDAPKGYNKGAFCIPEEGDEWLGTDGLVYQEQPAQLQPRILLHKKRVLRQTVVTDIGEVRPVKHGEWFRNARGGIEQWLIPSPSLHSYPVVRHEERMVEE